MAVSAWAPLTPGAVWVGESLGRCRWDAEMSQILQPLRDHEVEEEMLFTIEMVPEAQQPPPPDTSPLPVWLHPMPSVRPQAWHPLCPWPLPAVPAGSARCAHGLCPQGGLGRTQAALREGAACLQSGSSVTNH